jgi:hypothetical protein
MPSYYFSHPHQAFVKQCSCCKELTIGTKNQDESIEIFAQTFSPSAGAACMSDGMQSRCWFCNSSKRRSLGITRLDMERMYEAQNGQCAICSKEISIKRNAYEDVHAHVDHDESNGQVRGLLCGNCNRGIGCLQHNPDILRAAIGYLAPKVVELKVTRR